MMTVGMWHFALVAVLLMLNPAPAVSFEEASFCGAKETSDEVASTFNLSREVVIVTGGDSGLGFATATSMAKTGATVIIATHNLSKGERAASAIANATGGVVYGYGLDLGSFMSVRAFAQKFIKDFDGNLDILFNNAGISGFKGADALTGDGFEQIFQVDYLGPFLLTELLLPALRKSKGRIINTASTFHKGACLFAGLPHNCLKDWSNIPPQPVSGRMPWYEGGEQKSLYGLSKFMQIMHAQELASRESSNGVVAFSLCPGLVETDMTHADSWRDRAAKDMLCIVAHQADCPYNAQEGAAVLAYTALKAPSQNSGAWYTRYSDCHPAEVSMNGFTHAMRPQLYSKSLEWVGIQQSSPIGQIMV